MFQLEPPSRHHPPNLGTIPHPVSAARMRPRQTPQTRCLSDLDDGIQYPTRIPNVMYKIRTLNFFRSQTARQMIWARGFFPLATATQTLLWSGRPISSHVAASKVRHQSLAGTSLTGQLVFLSKFTSLMLQALMSGSKMWGAASVWGFGSVGRSKLAMLLLE